VNIALRRKRETQFQRAADGSMTLLEHLRELRSRLFKASLGIAAGFGVGWWLGRRVMHLLQEPYCKIALQQAVTRAQHDKVPMAANYRCPMLMLQATDGLVLYMQIALWIALIVSAPIWLYQLWAFIAPGLHRNERRWAYTFAGVAGPLFAAGAGMAYLVVGRGLEFLLSFNGGAEVNLEIKNYFSFVTGLVMLFGLAFEFPLVVILFNLAGIATYQRLLGWWRIAVFAFFAFSAIAIPTGDPFTMTALGLGLTALYFGAVLFAFVNDKRRDRKNRALYGNVNDDEISPLNFDDSESVEAGSSVGAPEPVAPPRPLERRYDDMT
jgi:sec-independent protein translocase protein TatC